MRLLRYWERTYTSASESFVEIRLGLTDRNALFLYFMLLGCLFGVMVFFILDAILHRWVCRCSPPTFLHESHWWNKLALFELILNGNWIPVRILIYSGMAATNIPRLILQNWYLSNFPINLFRARLILLMTEPCFVFISRAITHTVILKLWRFINVGFVFAFICLIRLQWAKSSTWRNDTECV